MTAPTWGRFLHTVPVTERKASHTEMTTASAEQAEAQDLDLTNSSAMIFGTPMIAHPWPDSDRLNEALREMILAKEKESNGLVRSNVGGWHSETDFFTWDAECIRTLRSRVQQLTIALTRMIMLTPEGPRRFNYRLDGWANLGR